MHLRFSPKIRLLGRPPNPPARAALLPCQTLHRWSGYAPLRALNTDRPGAIAGPVLSLALASPGERPAAYRRWPWRSKPPAFPSWQRRTRHRLFSSRPAARHTRLAAFCRWGAFAGPACQTRPWPPYAAGFPFRGRPETSYCTRPCGRRRTRRGSWSSWQSAFAARRSRPCAPPCA